MLTLDFYSLKRGFDFKHPFGDVCSQILNEKHFPEKFALWSIQGLCILRYHVSPRLNLDGKSEISLF